MKAGRLGVRLLLAGASILVVGGCARSADSSDALVVAAASDLRDAFGELAGELGTTDVGEVTFVFGSSGMLREQILNGAPYDVYVSANVGFVDEVIAAGMSVSAQPTIYAIGSLAVVTSGEVELTSIAAVVTDARRIVIAQPKHAPYGVAAREALQTLGLWDTVESRIVYADNVADAVRIVQSGEVDAGIVARSLVINDPHLVVDSSLHEPLRQAAVVLRGPRESRARAFVDALRTDTVRALMVRYGFDTDVAANGEE